jgi:hypothetical protein
MPKRETTPNAVDALSKGVWTAAEVATLLDVPLVLVERWCRLQILPARWRGDQWWIEGRALFLFCHRRIEPHYKPETIAGLLDRSVETVYSWIKSGRLKTIKLGAAKSATVLVAESELRRWMAL